MRIVVDARRCIGAAACVMVADDLFDLNEGGVVTLLRQPDVASEARAREAVNSCPTGAIAFEEQ